MANRDNPTNTSRFPSSPPYDNLTVIDAAHVISLQPTQNSNCNRAQLPGPGRVVQEGIFRKRAHDARVLLGECSQTRPTQDFVRDVINDPVGVDTDFSSPQWTSTIDYIIREGSYMNRIPPFWTEISEIHCPPSEFIKVKKMVAMISSANTNAFGDLLITLKDPSGKIDGTMHHNIFENNENKLAAAVRAVLILHNVTVGRFGSKTKYINIWSRNVVKIIGVRSMVVEYKPAIIKNEINSGDEYESVPDSDVDE